VGLENVEMGIAFQQLHTIVVLVGSKVRFIIGSGPF
jgi:hypothetical protein